MTTALAAIEAGARTAAEVAARLAVTEDAAKHVLDRLVVHDQAEMLPVGGVWHYLPSGRPFRGVNDWGLRGAVCGMVKL